MKYLLLLVLFFFISAYAGSKQIEVRNLSGTNIKVHAINSTIGEPCQPVSFAMAANEAQRFIICPYNQSNDKITVHFSVGLLAIRTLAKPVSDNVCTAYPRNPDDITAPIVDCE